MILGRFSPGYAAEGRAEASAPSPLPQRGRRAGLCWQSGSAAGGCCGRVDLISIAQAVCPLVIHTHFGFIYVSVHAEAKNRLHVVPRLPH